MPEDPKAFLKAHAKLKVVRMAMTAYELAKPELCNVNDAFYVYVEAPNGDSGVVTVNRLGNCLSWFEMGHRRHGAPPPWVIAAVAAEETLTKPDSFTYTGKTPAETGLGPQDGNDEETDVWVNCHVSLSGQFMAFTNDRFTAFPKSRDVVEAETPRAALAQLPGPARDLPSLGWTGLPAHPQRLQMWTSPAYYFIGEEPKHIRLSFFVRDGNITNIEMTLNGLSTQFLHRIAWADFFPLLAAMVKPLKTKLPEDELELPSLRAFKSSWHRYSKRFWSRQV